MKPTGKRIAINTRLLLPGGMEGVARFTDEVCKRLVKLRPQDEFLFFFDRPYDRQFVYSNNVTPIVLSPAARHPFLFKAWFDFSVAGALRNYHADLFFSPDGFGCLRTKVPQLISIHDLAYLHFPHHLPFFNLWYYRIYMPQFIAKASRLHAVSKFTADDLIKHFPTAANKTTVIHNGPDEGYKPLSEEEKSNIRNSFTEGLPYFLYAGAIHPRKNIENLIEAFNIFRKENKQRYKLIIAGRFAWKTDEIKNAIHNSPYQNDILLPGFVDENQLIQLMGAAHAFVYPSLFEGFGIPVLNAMNAGVPVITTKGSAMEEVCGNAALLANAHKPKVLAIAMLQLAQDENTCRKLIARGLENAQNFSWDTTAEKISEEIDFVLANG